MRWGVAVLALVLILASVPAAAGPDLARADRDAALAYVATYLDTGGDVDEVAPLAVEAGVAAGLDPAAWPSPEASALSRLDVGDDVDLQRLLPAAHALAVAGRLPADGPVAQRILASFNATQFGDPALVRDDMWSILALSEAGLANRSEVAKGANFVLSQQRSGGWSWAAASAGEPQTTDATGLAVVALQATGQLMPHAKGGAIAFMDRLGPDGASPLSKGGPPNCASTVWSLRARLAIAMVPPEAAWAFLAGLRQRDGSFAFVPGGDASVECTAQAATVLSQAMASGADLAPYDRPLPVSAPASPWAALPVLLLAASMRRRSPGPKG